MTETAYSIYRWYDGEMHFTRRQWIKHEIGEQVTDEMVRAAVEADVGYFTPGKYRAVPEDRWVDFEVKAEVELS